MKGKGRLSLRARVSLVLVMVVAAALGVANVAVYAFASSFLEQRLDEQLLSLSGPAAGLAMRAERNETDRVFPPPSPDRLRARASSIDITRAYIEARSPGGQTIDGRYLLESDAEPHTPPQLPPDLSVPPDSSVELDTTASEGGTQIPYRVRASSMQDHSVVIVALPKSDLEATRARLVLIQSAATTGVLALVAGLTWWLVGVGLRPLARMESTAGRIAQGDLSQRVEPSGQGTEIARLGAALNGMLAEIESAFAAKDLSERKLRRFVADASHELRTPLTSIRGYAELLRRGTLKDPSEIASAAGRIESEATRLGSLVGDLLLLARLDEGSQLARVPVDLAEVVAEVVDDARIVEPNRPIRISVSGHTVVGGDRDQLTQVATNLVNNAMVHTPTGSAVEVTVTEEPGVVVLAVCDSGPGIDPQEVERVFDRFFRADPSRSRDRGGSGLGLAIVAAIVETHDGRCEVRATPGGGATVRVLLPHRDPGPTGVADPVARPPESPTGSALGRPKR